MSQSSDRRCAAVDETHVRADPKPLNADPQRNTVAMQKVFEERFQAARAADALVDFLDLAVREFFPARPNRGVVPQTVEKHFDLAQRESHLAGKADEDHAVERVRGVPALAACAVGRSAHNFRKQRVAVCKGRALCGQVAYLLNG